MAKKKKGSGGNSLAIRLQQIASDAQVSAQRLANEATEKSFKYNTEEANTARAWQTEMSNTAHQREVEDLKKAGLNPVLSSNQGAQSYTTSSASAQANDPSGAYSNLAATQMQGIASGYQADVSAKATRAAAAKQAAAMRASAAASASAARYAADMAYASNKYAWDKKFAMQKYEYKNKPASNIASLADKYLSNAGITGSAVKGVKSILKDVNTKSLVSIYNGNNDFKLSKLGVSKMNQACAQLGIASTSQNRYLVAKALLGNQSALNLLRYKYSPPGSKHNKVHQR